MSQSSGRKPGSGIDPAPAQGGATAIGLGMLALLLLFVILNSYTIVDAGYRGVVKTFGEVTDVFGEGLHFRTPFITSVVHVDIRTQRHQSNATAASKDLQTVESTVVLNYRPEPANVGNLIRDIGPAYVDIIVEPAIQESVKAATARFTAEQLITQRPEVRDAIREDLISRLDEYNIAVQAISITDFSFSADFAAAIEAKQVAEQDALRAQQELERARIEAQQQVARAEAEAEARLTIAEAEAEALRLQREVISPELLRLRFIEKWDGILPSFLMGGDTGAVPLINIPESQFLTQPQEPAPTPNPEPEEPSEPTP